MRRSRRAFMARGAALVLAGGASQAAERHDLRVQRIGFLANTPPLADLVRRSSSNPAPRLVEEGLRDLGWVDGKNIQIVWRSAEGRYERLGSLVDEMIRMPVDVIVAFGPGVKEAAVRTSTIPIVMGAIGSVDETHVGLFSRPNRNITGMTLEAGSEFDGKRLALLRDAAPGMKRVAFLTQAPPEAASLSAGTSQAAVKLGLAAFTVHAPSLRELDAAFAAAIGKGADAVVVTDWPAFNNRDAQAKIHELARRHRLPAMYCVLDAADSGGLMSYAADILDNYRRIPYFVDKLLRGAKPADLPIEQPRRFALAVNLGAARAIGVAIPPSLLAQADRVISGN